MPRPVVASAVAMCARSWRPDLMNSSPAASLAPAERRLQGRHIALSQDPALIVVEADQIRFIQPLTGAVLLVADPQVAAIFKAPRPADVAAARVMNCVACGFQHLARLAGFGLGRGRIKPFPEIGRGHRSAPVIAILGSAARWRCSGRQRNPTRAVPAETTPSGVMQGARRPATERL